MHKPLELIYQFLFSPQWPCGRRPSDQETSPHRCPGRRTLPLVGGREGEWGSKEEGGGREKGEEGGRREGGRKKVMNGRND